MTARASSTRERLALSAVRLAGGLSRALALGSGSTVGGRIGLAVEPRLVGALASGRRVAIVSGTNGKTTTTRFLAEALAVGLGSPMRRAPVAWSSAGANMPAGIVAALAGAGPGDLGVLEVDEAYVPRVIAQTSPEVTVLLNLSRDQLDRVSEVRMLASRWSAGLDGYAGTVVANADDPLVVWATRAASSPRFVAVGGLWRADAHHCPACDSRIVFPPPQRTTPSATKRDGTDRDLGWRCSGCDFARPEPFAVLDDSGLTVAGRAPIAFALAVPGRFNRANAAMAAVAADAMGVDAAVALGAISGVTEVAGRFSLAHYGDVVVRLLLAKNPAGWSELVELVRDGAGPVVVAINSEVADGHDPSWLWDVPFEALAGRPVVAAGQRSLDLAVRLLHAGVDHHLAADLSDALVRAGRASPGVPGTPRVPVDVIGNYTAFQDLRRLTSHAAHHRVTAGVDADRTAPGTARRVVAAREAQAADEPAPTRSRRRNDSRLQVVVVHPDLLGTYGDGGNGRVLANRAAWRGYDVDLVLAPSDRPLPRSGDLYCLGGGEDGPQLRSASLLREGPLASAVQAGAVLFAVCAGYQIIGERFSGPGGSEHDGVGLLPVRTIRGPGRRAVGEVLSVPVAPLAGVHLATMSGFENHAGHTLLAKGATPLGRVVLGVGNDGRGGEGAVAGRVIGTYLHGPVLARNPDLADALLALATGHALEPLASPVEEALRSARVAAARSAARRQGARRLVARRDQAGRTRRAPPA